MFDLVFDNRTTVYLLLATATLIAAAVWFRSRQRLWSAVLGAAVGLLALFAVVDLFLRPKTDREQLRSKLEELAAATRTPDAGKLAAFFSADFRSPAGSPREEFCRAGAAALRSNRVDEVVVWDFRFGEVSRAARKAQVRAHVKVKGSALMADADVEFDFRLDPDNEWRIQGLKVFFLPGSTEEYPLRF